MAGKQYGKHKTLAIYDFFRSKVSVDDKDNGTTVEDIRKYLDDLFDDEFERKSIYADIDVINQYRMMINPSDKEWIEHKGKNAYVRNLDSEDFTMDEVHLLLDAVNATPIVEERIAGKIKKQWPAYFKNDGYVSFLACERKKPSRAFVFLMNSLRKAIKNKEVLKIKYGYKLMDEDPKNCIEKERKISPIALYYEENKYYLFAIDNDLMAKYEGTLEDSIAKIKSLRQFRIDRISNHVQFLGKEEFIECDVSVVKEKITGAVDAYSSGKSVDVRMTLEGDPELILRAFNYLRNEITIKSIFNDNWSGGKLSFFINVSPTPRFFSLLMNLSSFETTDVSEGVKITLDASKEFQDAYEEFLIKSKNNINFTTPL